MKRLITIIAILYCCTAGATDSICVRVDTTPKAGFEISPLLFGTFSEMHGGDIIPGIYEEYIVNPSFEAWYKDANGDKTDLLWQSQKEFEGVAFPWESRKTSGNPVFSLSRECFNTDTAQKISVAEGDKAALVQRLALPDYRTGRYNLSFYAKIDGEVRLDVDFYNKEGRKSTVRHIDGLGGEWKKVEIKDISLDRTDSRFNGRYGIYSIRFSVAGEGYVLLDMVTLFPSDCIDGVFNPETIGYFKKYKVSCMRWPGGNFTSGYHWKNGIGPADSRISDANLAWNGVNSNLMGTDEFLRFCELTGAEPVMGVGYGLVTQEEAADWVEYCNGEVSTPMGALRAANGHPEPYGVIYWGVGNEVYGDYQLGNTDARSYADGLVPTIEKMKAVDPSIKVIASAYGVHNSFRKPLDWNRIVSETAGESLDMYDAHLYVHGPGAKTTKKFSEEQLFRIFAAAPLYFRKYLDQYRSDTDSKPLSLLEWGVLPSARDPHVPERQKFSNLLLSACLYNEMIRNSDIVKAAAAHNFSYYVAPQKNHSEPVNPRTVLFDAYSGFRGAQLLETDCPSVPAYEVSENFPDVGSWDCVPELDIVTARKDGKVLVAIVNKSLDKKYSVPIELTGCRVLSAKGRCLSSDHPFLRVGWKTSERTLNDRPAKVKKKGRNIRIEVPALSLTVVEIAVNVSNT